MEFLRLLIIKISWFTPLITVLIAIIFWKQTRHYRAFTNTILVIQLLSLLGDTVSYYFFRDGLNNLMIINGYFVLHFLLILYFYYQSINREIVKLIAFVGIIFFVLNTILFQPFTIGQYNSWAVSCALLVIPAINHLWIKSSSSVSASEKLSVWCFSIGIAFYGLFSTLIFVFHDKLFEIYGNQVKYVWLFHNMTNIYKNLAFAGAIYWYAHDQIAWSSAKKEDKRK